MGFHGKTANTRVIRMTNIRLSRYVYPPISLYETSKQKKRTKQTNTNKQKKIIQTNKQTQTSHTPNCKVGASSRLTVPVQWRTRPKWYYIYMSFGFRSCSAIVRLDSRALRGQCCCTDYGSAGRCLCLASIIKHGRWVIKSAELIFFVDTSTY